MKVPYDVSSIGGLPRRASQAAGKTLEWIEQVEQGPPLAPGLGLSIGLWRIGRLLP
jgi:hypothetical protein